MTSACMWVMLPAPSGTLSVTVALLATVSVGACAALFRVIHCVYFPGVLLPVCEHSSGLLP